MKMANLISGGATISQALSVEGISSDSDVGVGAFAHASQNVRKFEKRSKIATCFCQQKPVAVGIQVFSEWLKAVAKFWMQHGTVTQCTCERNRFNLVNICF